MENFMTQFLLVTNIIRRFLHFTNSVSISYNPNKISIAKSDEKLATNLQMDIDTDSSSVIMTSPSLELNMEEEDAGSKHVINSLIDHSPMNSFNIFLLLFRTQSDAIGNLN